MRRARDGALAASTERQQRDARASRRPRSVAPPLQVLLLMLMSFALMCIYLFNTYFAEDPLIASNRPAGFHADGAIGVHPDIEENEILEFAEPTSLDGVTKPTKIFAYMFYVTHDSYVCGVIHAMHQLQKLRMDTKTIDLVVLYSQDVSIDKIQRIERLFSARTIPIVRILADVEDLTWHESFTKLRSFEDFGYKRVVFLESDSVPIQNLDHLFLLPSTPLYAPTAYWLPQPFFATTLLVIEPSTKRFLDILRFARAHVDSHTYDMELLNAFFAKTVMYLTPDYTVLNSDFRTEPTQYHPVFDVMTSQLPLKAKLVHFSCRPDGSYGKPWAVKNHEITPLQDLGFDAFFGLLFVDYWHTEETLCTQRELSTHSISNIRNSPTAN